MRCAFCRRHILHVYEDSVLVDEHEWFCTFRCRNRKRAGYEYIAWRQKMLPMFALLVIFAIFYFLITTIAGKAYGHVEGTPHRDWLAQQWSVGDKDKGFFPISCCDNSDGYVLNDDEWRTSNGVYEVRINNAWHKIERHHMRDTKGGENPYPNALVWYRAHAKGVSIYCFAPGFVT